MLFKKVLFLIKYMQIKMVNGSNIKIRGIIRAAYLSDIYTRSKGKISIGKEVYCETGVRISATNKGHIEIGDKSYFNRFCVICCRDEIKIGKNVALGPSVMIYDHDHCIDSNGYNNNYKSKKVVIGDNCWIGAGTIILKGVEIGNNSVIGAGCVIQQNIPPYSIVKSNRSLTIKEIL